MPSHISEKCVKLLSVFDNTLHVASEVKLSVALTNCGEMIVMNVTLTDCGEMIVMYKLWQRKAPASLPVKPIRGGEPIWENQHVHVLQWLTGTCCEYLMKEVDQPKMFKHHRWFWKKKNKPWLLFTQSVTIFTCGLHDFGHVRMWKVACSDTTMADNGDTC